MKSKAKPCVSSPSPNCALHWERWDALRSPPFSAFFLAVAGEEIHGERGAKFWQGPFLFKGMTDKIGPFFHFRVSAAPWLNAPPHALVRFPRRPALARHRIQTETLPAIARRCLQSSPERAIPQVRVFVKLLARFSDRPHFWLPRRVQCGSFSLARAAPRSHSRARSRAVARPSQPLLQEPFPDDPH